MTVDQSAPVPEQPSPAPPVGVLGASSLWRAVMGICGVVVPGVFVFLALMGAVVTPPVTMLLVAPLIGCWAGLMVVLLNSASLGEPWARRGIMYTGAVAAAFLPFTNGVTLFGDVGGVLALVLLVLGSCLAADRLADLVERLPPTGGPRDDHWLQVVMPSLPTPALLKEWRATRAVFGGRRDLVKQARAVHVRGLLLEELARRDPAAVERWLISGDWSSEPKMRTDRDVAG